jgi:hypothetical protein
MKQIINQIQIMGSTTSYATCFHMETNQHQAHDGKPGLKDLIFRATGYTLIDAA